MFCSSLPELLFLSSASADAAQWTGTTSGTVTWWSYTAKFTPWKVQADIFYIGSKLYVVCNNYSKKSTKTQNKLVSNILHARESHLSRLSFLDCIQRTNKSAYFTDGDGFGSGSDAASWRDAATARRTRTSAGRSWTVTWTCRTAWRRWRRQVGLKTRTILSRALRDKHILEIFFYLTCTVISLKPACPPFWRIANTLHVIGSAHVYLRKVQMHCLCDVGILMHDLAEHSHRVLIQLPQFADVHVFL